MGNILSSRVVYGSLPLPVVIASSIITFPAAVILVVIAIISYRRSRNAKMVGIILGTLVVSIAGSLYIAAFPPPLYYSEFSGIILLWLGFVDFRKMADSIK